MEKIEKKFLNVSEALRSMKKAVSDFEKVKTGERDDPDDYLRDAVIKRFEFTLDTTWKYLKLYLEKGLGIMLENKGPKAVFRECLKTDLLSEEETVNALEMINDRNMTSHIYKEEIADGISKNAYKYHQLMEKAVGKTRK